MKFSIVESTSDNFVESAKPKKATKHEVIQTPVQFIQGQPTSQIKEKL